MISHDVARRLASAIAPRKESDAPEVSSGTVTRTDTDGTVWVRLFGADDDTPCTGSTAAAKPGDVVTVTIDGGSARVDGNVTAPATDDAMADEAVRMTERVAEDVVEVRESAASANAAAVVARVAASEAQAVAEATGQHFWADDGGIHVTEAEGDAATDHNILINSLGFLLRGAINNFASITQGAVAFYDGLGNNASNVMAQFGATLARIGKQAAAHVDITSTATQFFGRDGSTQVAEIGLMQNSDDARLWLKDRWRYITSGQESSTSDGVTTYTDVLIIGDYGSGNGHEAKAQVLASGTSGSASVSVNSTSSTGSTVNIDPDGVRLDPGVDLYALDSGAYLNDLHVYDAASVTGQLSAGSLVLSSALPVAQGGTGSASVYKTSTASDVISAASGRTLGTITYAEWGKVAQLSVTVSGFAATTGSQTVGTVVDGKRPPYSVYATAVTSTSAPYASLGADGALSVYWASAPGTSTNYTMRFVYLLA